MPLIKEVFTPALERHGFCLTRTVTLGLHHRLDLAEYAAGQRIISAEYVPSEESWLDITIQGYGGDEPVGSLSTFVNNLMEERHVRIRTREATTFSLEVIKWCELLQDHCREFLIGDLSAFRRKYRELLLVQRLRNAIYTAYATRDWSAFRRYHDWLQDYWTKSDLELLEKAARHIGGNADA